MAHGYAFLIVGVLAILLGLFDWRKDRRLRAVGKRTDGLVIEMRWSSRRAFPVFRFQTSDGRVVTIQGRFGTSPPMYRPGDAVRVLYDPAKPEHARIDRTTFGSGRILFLLAFGMLFAAIGVWALRLAP